MSSRSKNIFMGILAVGIVTMTIAYAAFSTNLRINGTASIPNINWNIYFDAWSLDTASTVNGHQNTAEYPSINELSQSLSPYATKIDNLNVTLYQPGDYAKYNFQIVNGGTIDAILENFEKNLTCASGNDCSHLEYNIECKDSLSGGSNVLESGSSLLVNARAYCSLEVKYKDQTNQNSGSAGQNQIYTQSAASATLDATWVYTQHKAMYTYYSGSGTTNTLSEASTDYWIQTNKTTGAKEACRYSGDRVGDILCVKPNNWDCGEVVNNNCSNSTGYIASKLAEFRNAGATCTWGGVSFDCSISISNVSAGLLMYNYGRVEAYRGGHTCAVDGSWQSCY